MLPCAQQQVFPECVHYSVFPAVGTFVITISKRKQISQNDPKKKLAFQKNFNSLVKRSFYYAAHRCIPPCTALYELRNSTSKSWEEIRCRLFCDSKITNSWKTKLLMFLCYFTENAGKQRDIRLKSNSKFPACIPGQELNKSQHLCT